MMYECGCFRFLDVYFYNPVVFDVSYVILYYVAIGLVEVVLYR